MATKSRKNTGRSNNGNYGGATFAEVRYTAEDQDAFLQWSQKNGASILEVMDILIDDGYRLTVKYDYNNNCAMATVTQQDDSKHKNSNIILSCRASTVDHAVYLAAWTIFEMYPSEPLPTSRGSDDLWI